MLRALLYIFGGLFTAYGLFGILYMIYWTAVNGSIEPEMQAVNELLLKTWAEKLERPAYLCSWALYCFLFSEL